MKLQFKLHISIEPAATSLQRFINSNPNSYWSLIQLFQSFNMSSDLNWWEHRKFGYPKSSKIGTTWFLEKGDLSGKMAILKGFLRHVLGKNQIFLYWFYYLYKACRFWLRFFVFDTLSCFASVGWRVLKGSKLSHARWVVLTVKLHRTIIISAFSGSQSPINDFKSASADLWQKLHVWLQQSNMHIASGAILVPSESYFYLINVVICMLIVSLRQSNLLIWETMIVVSLRLLPTPIVNSNIHFLLTVGRPRMKKSHCGRIRV